MVSIDELEQQLNSAADMERLLLMTRLAKHLSCRDRERARSLACEACILSYVLEKRFPVVDVLSARATALFVLVFCEELCDCDIDTGSYTEEAYSLLAELPRPTAARVLLRAGQLYQQAARYSRAFYFFRQAEAMLNNIPGHRGISTGPG